MDSKKIGIGLIIAFLFLGSFFLISRFSGAETELKEGFTRDVIDMQGYELDVPDGFQCTGGFTDGYRYVDAECLPDAGGFKIVSETGLTATSVGESGLVSHHIGYRSREFTGGSDDIVCEQLIHDDLTLDAENYVCVHSTDGDRTITVGTGKTFGEVARWFESHLIVLEEEDIENEKYIDIMALFLDESIDIDWDDYKV